MTMEELFSLAGGRDGAVELGIHLCAGIEDRAGARGVHGAVRPGNISLGEDGGAALGPAGHVPPAEMGAEELEYVSPEMFWSGREGPAGDVYALGLILYGLINGGRLPFYPPEGEAGPDSRAAAMRSRMQAESIPAPPGCDAGIWAVVSRALSFREEERWPDAAALSRALESCPTAEEAGPAPIAVSEPAPVPIPEPAPEPESAPELEPAAEPAYEPEREAREQTAPAAADKAAAARQARERARARGRRRMGILVGAVALILLLVIILLAKSCSGQGQETEAGGASGAETGGEANMELLDAELLEEVEPPELDGEMNGETELPVIHTEPAAVYTVTAGDLTWEEAEAACREQGGHLAVVHDQAELDALIAQADSQGLKYLWLGASRDADGNWQWVNGDEVDFYPWDSSEPSWRDGYDGAAEDYLMLWNVTFGNHKGWAYNDSRIDPASAYPASYSGSLGYAMQTD